MSATARTLVVVLLLVIVGAALGPLPAARAGDTGALIGGLIAGAIVYELLDDDDDVYCRRYYGYDYYPNRYYPPPVYYRSPYCYRTPSYSVGVWYDYSYPRSGSCYYRDYGPRYESRRAPSHARRNVGTPPLYRGGPDGGKYGPPRGYK